MSLHPKQGYTIGYKLAGGTAVTGTIHCSGAKNFATKALVASLLSSSPSTLTNVPHIGDVETTEHLIEQLGAKLNWSAPDTLQIDPSNITESKVFLADSRRNRISILLLSVLLHRLGECVVPTAAGDRIGKRPVDFHISALEAFGASIEYRHDSYIAHTRSRLKGCHFTLPYPSVGATESCLLAAVLAEGTTIIQNVALEPEVIALITMLRSMGAIIFLKNNREIIIHGVDRLDGTTAHIIGDRIEAASWACLACASDGRLRVTGIRPESLGNFLAYYSLAGGGHSVIDEQTIEFFRRTKLRPIVLETDVYPGFSTDWQQPFATLLTQAEGISVIHETVYEQRFGYLEVLNKLGARAEVTKACLGGLACRYRGYDYEHSALIQGQSKLHSINSPIFVPDLRAGLAYIIAAALAEGETVLLGSEQIERGYGNLEKKLKNTNASIQRFESPLG